VTTTADHGRDLGIAAEKLVAGELVAFPTETVYGLGADASQPAAVARIFSLKGRPRGHPVIVHLAHHADPERYYARDLPRVAHRLIEQFWPGPLTLVLKRQEGHAAEAAGGQPTIGLRCPDHPLAQALLREVSRRSPDAGLAAPSANRFGHVSPTTAAHVRDEFGATLFILDGGPCRVGIESTILDLSRYDREGAVLLRPGGVARAALAQILGEAPREADQHAPRASGTLASHYAPEKPLTLVAAGQLSELPLETAVWAFQAPPATRDGVGPWLMAPARPGDYASQLYAVLRRLDHSAATAIAIEHPPLDPDWEAINDRLRRAATR
jgi:L-threonylcarbamoyladenylate synthase